MVAVCGKNAALREKLQKRAAAGEWPGVEVNVMGFVKKMSELMEVADCLVTKAGPGTIAEACCCGLPIMLSGHLPGQESGNVGFVVDGGFGAYDAEPESIASTVCGWLEDEETLRAMSERSKAASRPSATGNIADDIVKLVPQELDERVIGVDVVDLECSLVRRRDIILRADRHLPQSVAQPLQARAARDAPPVELLGVRNRDR